MPAVPAFNELLSTACTNDQGVPEKIPIPDTREFWLEYGYLPNINTRKSLLTHTQLIPNTRAKYPTCWVRTLVRFRGLFTTVCPEFGTYLARVRVFTRHQYPTKFPVGYFQIPDIQLKVPLRVYPYPYPYPYPTGFFVGYTTLPTTNIHGHA